MRIVRASVAAALLWAAGGCSSDGGDTVSLTFDNGSSDFKALGLSGLNASNGSSVSDAEGVFTFTASGGGTTLTMLVQGPIAASSDTGVPLDQDHNYLSIDTKSKGGWSSNGGKVFFDGVKPYRIRFDSVPMIVGAAPAAGTFTLAGSGTFK